MTHERCTRLFSDLPRGPWVAIGWSMVAVIVAALCAVPCRSEQPSGVKRFEFGPGPLRPGYTRVEPSTLYTAERGYGFEPGGEIDGPGRQAESASEAPPTGTCSTSGKPFFFSVRVPAGNYRVTVTLGSPSGPSDTTVRTECRRLMLEDVRTTAGQTVTRTLTANVHNTHLPGGKRVRIKPRERGALRWDDKLTLEFRGPRPCVQAVEISPDDDAITVYIAGDSTVTDQIVPPWAGWGQMLPRFFRGQGVAISNHAASGESLSSFVSERRWEKLLSTVRKGDYLLVQFGHNDMKQHGPDAGAFKNYTRLLEQFVADARQRGVTPVLITPMHRLDFTADGKVRNTLGDYPDAMRRVAEESGVMLIDLNAMSRGMYEKLGPEATQRLFVDQTHTNERGAYLFADYIAREIKQSRLGLAAYVVDDLPPEELINLPPASEGSVGAQ
jgi:lysophospholipase L1-like esterase